MDLPREPEALTEAVARLAEARPGHPTVTIIGPLELTIDGQLMDLTDMYRTALAEGPLNLHEVQHFIDAHISAIRLSALNLPFEAVVERIMPRIQTEAFVNSHRAQLVAHQPFVNGTAIVFVIDLPDVDCLITTEQLIRWGVDIDELDCLARQNLAAYQPEIEMRLFGGDAGAAVMFNMGDTYDASRLLLYHLHERLAEELGGEFLAAIPARDLMLAMSIGPEKFIERFHSVVRQDHRRLPHPITDDLFLVTYDGVAGWAPQ